MYVCVYAHVYVCTCVFVHMSVCVHICMSISVCVFIAVFYGLSEGESPNSQ